MKLTTKQIKQMINEELNEMMGEDIIGEAAMEVYKRIMEYKPMPPETVPLSMSDVLSTGNKARIDRTIDFRIQPVIVEVAEEMDIDLYRRGMAQSIVSRATKLIKTFKPKGYFE